MDKVRKPNISVTFMVLLKRGKNYEIAVCLPKETIFKEMAAKIE
jgi:hypothetical protein